MHIEKIRKGCVYPGKIIRYRNAREGDYLCLRDMTHEGPEMVLQETFGGSGQDH